jgi:hypothetical protein
MVNLDFINELAEATKEVSIGKRNINCLVCSPEKSSELNALHQKQKEGIDGMLSRDALSISRPLSKLSADKSNRGELGSIIGQRRVSGK